MYNILLRGTLFGFAWNHKDEKKMDGSFPDFSVGRNLFAVF